MLINREDMWTNSNNHPNLTIVPTAKDWYAGGQRVAYDPIRKRIVDHPSNQTITVFERTSLGAITSTGNRWTTFLPGFPHGSYGYAKIEPLLIDPHTPRLFIEYVGHGDSDKPRAYQYSTMERADLVEAQWRAHHIRRTVVVAFDYSSLVLLELLRRSQERASQGNSQGLPRIEHIMIVNGGLFANGYTRTPFLTSRFGRIGSQLAQRSNIAMNIMMRPQYSKSYRRSATTAKQELQEASKAIRLRKGCLIMPLAAGFMIEHKQNAERWNMAALYRDYCQNNGTTVVVVGSLEDSDQHKQLDMARKHLGPYYPAVRIETIPGGHLATTEKASVLAEMIQRLEKKTSSDGPVERPWTQLEQNHTTMIYHDRPWTQVQQPSSSWRHG